MAGVNQSQQQFQSLYSYSTKKTMISTGWLIIPILLESMWRGRCCFYPTDNHQWCSLKQIQPQHSQSHHHAHITVSLRVQMLQDLGDKYSGLLVKLEEVMQSTDRTFLNWK